MADKRKVEYPQLTGELVVDGLKKLGLSKGDLVFVHSSVKDIAPARQVLALKDMGMPLVIDAFKEVVGQEGVLAFPTFTKTFRHRHDGPVEHIYDKSTTPSRVGDMTNYFLKDKQVVRSDHPTHSVAAWGERAGEYVSFHGHQDGTSFDTAGPWGRIPGWDGYICLYGTLTNTLTMVHAIEDWMNLPYLRNCDAVIKNAHGDAEFVTVTHMVPGPRDFYTFKESKLEKKFQQSGIFTKEKICMADVYLFKARDFTRWLWQAILDDPRLLLNDNKSDEWSQQAGMATEEHLANFKLGCPF